MTIIHAGLLFTLAERAFHWVRCKHRKTIEWEITPEMKRSAYLRINGDRVEDYHTLILTHGILFTLALQEYFIAKEQYERCTRINKAITKIQSDYGLILPASLHDVTAQHYYGMLPYEILVEMTARKTRLPKRDGTFIELPNSGNDSPVHR